MSEKDLEEDLSDDENHFLKFFQDNEIEDLFVFSEILNNPKFDSE